MCQNAYGPKMLYGKCLTRNNVFFHTSAPFNCDSNSIRVRYIDVQSIGDLCKSEKQLALVRFTVAKKIRIGLMSLRWRKESRCIEMRCVTFSIGWIRRKPLKIYSVCLTVRCVAAAAAAVWCVGFGSRFKIYVYTTMALRKRERDGSMFHSCIWRTINTVCRARCSVLFYSTTYSALDPMRSECKRDRCLCSRLNLKKKEEESKQWCLSMCDACVWH